MHYRSHEEKAKRNAFEKLQYTVDPTFKLKSQLCHYFNRKIKTLYHTGKCPRIPYIGCSHGELLEHLNSGKYTMQDYMTNVKGRILFHIDHIIPSKYFLNQLEFDENNEIINKEILHKWWNYKNLRIIPAHNNLSKNAVLDYNLIKKYNIEHLL